MEQIIEQPGIAEAQPDAPAQTQRRHVALPVEAHRIDIVLVWQDTLRTFGAHAAPILVCACAGCAGTELLNAAVSLADTQSTQASLCAFRVAPEWPRLLLAMVCGLGLLYTQAVIARIALQSASHPWVLCLASRAVLGRTPALLVNWLVYGALMASSAIGLSAALRAARLDPTSLQADARSAPALAAVIRELALRGANALIPDPGSPFCPIAYVAQSGPFNSWNVNGSTTWRMVNQGTPYAHTVSVPSATATDPAYLYSPYNFWLVTLGSVTLFVLIEVFLRFRLIAVMSNSGTGLVTSLIDSVQLAWSNFGTVAYQVLLLRLLTTLVQVLLIGVPMAFISQVVAPNLAHIISIAWMQPAQWVLTLASLALVNALITAFSTVYDVRLYTAIQTTCYIV